MAFDSKYVNQTVVLHSPTRDLIVHVHVLKARDPEQASVCCYPVVATGASLLANPHLDLALEYNPKLQPS